MSIVEKVRQYQKMKEQKGLLEKNMKALGEEIKKYAEEHAERDLMKDKSKELTRREVEVLKMIASGSSNKEIASTLSISERTVKNHVSNIFKKIDVSDRTQAAVFAIKNDIIKLK